MTKPAPWTNGQVGRMKRTIKEVTGQRYHYQTKDKLNRYRPAFLLAYNLLLRSPHWQGPRGSSADFAARAAAPLRPSNGAGTRNTKSALLTDV